MHKFNADLSDIINEYAYKPLQIGKNDCNIFFADYLDLVKETDFKSKLQDNYTTIPQGLKICKKLTGFNSVYEAALKYFVPAEEVQHGSVLLALRKIKTRDYYSATVVFGNQALIEENNIYVLKDVADIDYDFIFNKE
ncbi:hypothetical protein [Pantoea sp. MBLJ3]|uniref:DUF6950 family protein n=1 Tax=Pantoea sp. MBLJ3 TaxID=1562889 RepID=UPI00057F97BD|nr:hypothetical protein [Pantoea sp. MBLJ3]